MGLLWRIGGEREREREEREKMIQMGSHYEEWYEREKMEENS